MSQQVYKIIKSKKFEKQLSKAKLGKKSFQEVLTMVEDFAVHGCLSQSYINGGIFQEDKCHYLKKVRSKVRVMFQYDNTFVEATIHNGKYDGTMELLYIKQK